MPEKDKFPSIHDVMRQVNRDFAKKDDKINLFDRSKPPTITHNEIGFKQFLKAVEILLFAGSIYAGALLYDMRNGEKEVGKGTPAIELSIFYEEPKAAPMRNRYSPTPTPVLIPPRSRN